MGVKDMGSTVIVLQTVLAALPSIEVGVGKLIAWVKAVRKALMQNKAWTPELEAAFRAALWAKTGQAQYRPDPKA